LRHSPLFLVLCAISVAPFTVLAQQAGVGGEPGSAPGKLGEDTPAPGTTGVNPQTADEAFTTRVKTLEEQVVDLKEKIFRTKARLLLLQETVLGGDLSQGAGALIVHRNELSSIFALRAIAYALDGAPLHSAADKDGDLARREEFEIFNGRIVPGPHQLTVKMTYQGQGFGVFSYVDDYKFDVTASITFDAEPGKVTTLKAVAYDTGNITSQMKDRAAIRFDQSVAQDVVKAPGTDKPQAARAGATAP
jgi:hypothetical protein